MKINFQKTIIIFFILMPNLLMGSELQLTEEQLNNVSLSTVTVTSKEINPQINLTGILMNDQRRTYRVAPFVEGMVTKLNVVEHEKVRKGQVLARLRSNTLGQAQADYLEALANFELASAERDRIEGLWKEGVVPESRWLKVDSDFKSARANLEQRRRLLSLAGLSDVQIKALEKNPNRLAEFELTSPIDGWVTKVEIESGQLLSVGETAFHIDDLNILWAIVKIPVANLSQLKIDAEAVIKVQADRKQAYSGNLVSLGREVDEQSQTLNGRIVVKNPDGLLRPGMYTQVTLTGTAKTGLMVPASSVFRVGDLSYVFKVLGIRRFEPVVVDVGMESGGWVLVYSGIEENTEIVSKGVAELKSHWQYQGGE